MTFATLNVNSLNMRLPRPLDWLSTHNPEIVCLREAKREDFRFPLDANRATGYDVAYCGQKTYNGAAIQSRKSAADVVNTTPDIADEQKGVLAATVSGAQGAYAYIANGESVESPRYQYKMSGSREFPARRCHACAIDRDMRANEQPSDHAPVMAGSDRQAP